MNSQWEAVIGLEIHAQLKTKSKIFSPDKNEFGAGDNQMVDPVSLGLPGALPVLNKAVVDLAIKTGLAFGCEIQNQSIFARKNYFYPDMPKGYQISQFDKPICKNGHVEFYLNGKPKKIALERIHMEEDAGKSTHYGDYTLINLNRAGVPLLEIVSCPDIRSPQEAAEYSRAVRQTLRFLDVCDGNLEEGSMRVDCNVSIRRPGEKFGAKVELKNINSFRFVEKALEYEIQRQIDTLESGQQIFQETRLYDSVKNMTSSMRKKEDAHDYRYFPDPDLTPCRIFSEQLEQIKQQMPELPMQRVQRYVADLGLSYDDAVVLTSEKELSSYFEEVFAHCEDAHQSCHWVRGDLIGYLNEKKISIMQPEVIPAIYLSQMIQLIKDGTISGKIAKKVFKEMCETSVEPLKIIEKNGYKQLTDPNEIMAIIQQSFSNYPEQLEQLVSGKEKVFAFFVGQIMKMTKGQASPDVVNKLMTEEVRRRKVN